MKSVITDMVHAFGSNSSQQLETVIDNESGSNGRLHESHDAVVHGRRRSGFRRRGDTTTFEGPTGAPPLGSVSMAGAAGGGPAAWAAAAFGRSPDRKVTKCMNYPINYDSLVDKFLCRNQ